MASHSCGDFSVRICLIALDSSGEWYRYHALFRGLLRRRLEGARVRGARRCRGIDRRASDWFTEAGLIHGESITLWPQVIKWLRSMWWRKAAKRFSETGTGRTSIAGSGALPHEIVETQPKLLLAQAWMAWNENDHGAIPELLDLAKRAIGASTWPPALEGERQFLRDFSSSTMFRTCKASSVSRRRWR